MTPAHYLRLGAILGFGARETMMMCPGLLFDVWELYVQEHQPREE